MWDLIPIYWDLLYRLVSMTNCVPWVKKWRLVYVKFPSCSGIQICYRFRCMIIKTIAKDIKTAPFSLNGYIVIPWSLLSFNKHCSDVWRYVPANLDCRPICMHKLNYHLVLVVNREVMHIDSFWLDYHLNKGETKGQNL